MQGDTGPRTPPPGHEKKWGWWHPLTVSDVPANLIRRQVPDVRLVCSVIHVNKRKWRV